MEIIRGKQQNAMKCVIYGPEGIGKSTFASRFPRPIILDTEGSTGALDVDRVLVQSWTELTQAVDSLLQNSQDYATVVIDTADWAEKLCTEHIVSKNHWQGIEDAGYGKGYVYVAEEFGKLLNRLEQLKRRGLHVVLTAHAAMRKFEQPDEMNPYDRWELKLSKKCAPLLKEWSDMLLFANYKTFVVQSGDGKKAKATGGTRRVMYTQHAATWDAKNRFGLPPEMDFDFAGIAHLVQAAPTTPVAQSPTPAAPREEPKPARVQQATAPASPKEAPAAPAHAEKAPGVPEALARLMRPNRVAVAEIQAVVAQRGYYPASTPIANYDPAFVQGCLIAAWPQVEGLILQNREKMPF